MTVRCRFNGCPHGGIIDKEKDDYVLIGRSNYYHRDCLEIRDKQKNAEKNKKNDLIMLRTLWYENIDNNVIWWQLNNECNRLLKDGITTERMLFTLKYVISHKDRMKLRYPGGLKYYIYNDEIIEAYKLSKLKKTTGNKQFVRKQEETPRFVRPKTIIEKFNDRYR